MSNPPFSLPAREAYGRPGYQGDGVRGLEMSSEAGLVQGKDFFLFLVKARQLGSRKTQLRSVSLSVPCFLSLGYRKSMLNTFAVLFLFRLRELPVSTCSFPATAVPSLATHSLPGTVSRTICSILLFVLYFSLVKCF